uniref:Ligatin n=1 Tax=Kalanchoe fedtschenkoi TaxID=63787 RepID=A0A7N0U9Q7_KALFE
MFKKTVESKALQRLSGADKKKLRRTVKDRFRNASDADVDALLPPKVEITVAKFQNRVHVYGVEGGLPMIFDVDGRGTEIYPTVFALWKVPELLPAFTLKGGEVSHYIIGGADLMFPGICVPEEGLPTFVAGEPWAVKVPGNPAPIAVGTTTMSSDEALKAGLRGKALRITHYYGDALWESVEGRYVPNAGFLENVVFEDPSLSHAESDQLHGDTAAPAVHLNGENVAGELIDDSHVPSVVDIPLSTCDAVEQTADGVSSLNVTESGSLTEVNAKEQRNLSTEDVDVLLDQCLLQALHLTVKDNDLPLAGSTLWSNHVLPCRPQGVTLDIKKSSHKKLSKWLQAKSSSGLMTVKEDKHKKETVVHVINRKHPDYTSFKPVKRPIEKIDQINEESTSNPQSQTVLELVELYKSTVHVNPIFTSVGADVKDLYTASEATEVVFKYIEKENLVNPTNKALVSLDAVLCDALFKGLVKKGSTYPTEIHKKDLGHAFINRMQPNHVVTRGAKSVVRKGSVKTVQILTERRGGNKRMTRVSGLESFLVDAELLASELQKKFACSTSVAELPGKKGHEVLVQGGVIDNLAKHLVEQYGIPKRYIEVLDKTKK